MSEGQGRESISPRYSLNELTLYLLCWVSSDNHHSRPRAPPPPQQRLNILLLRLRPLTACCLRAWYGPDWKDISWILSILWICNNISDIANFTRRSTQYNVLLSLVITIYSTLGQGYAQGHGQEKSEDKCFQFSSFLVGSMGNPNHLLYDLYLFTFELRYRNDKSKTSFQPSKFSSDFSGETFFCHKLTWDHLLVQSTHLPNKMMKYWNAFLSDIWVLCSGETTEPIQLKSIVQHDSSSSHSSNQAPRRFLDLKADWIDTQTLTVFWDLSELVHSIYFRSQQ